MPTDVNTINSYSAFAKSWAKKLREKKNVLHEYLEKPAMYAKLPKLSGMRVLCIGCGTGEECQHLLELGAKKVIGIDISEGLIKIAQKSYKRIEFHVMDMEKLDFRDQSFDFAYSSLTLHYVKNWQKPLQEIYRVLKKSGTFLFSTQHPVHWGARKVKDKQKTTILMGYDRDKINDKWDIYGDYLNVRKVHDIWFDELEVSYYHKPISSIFQDIVKSKFEIIDLVEPKPIEAAKKVDKGFWEIYQKIPVVLVLEIRKRE